MTHQIPATDADRLEITWRTSLERTFTIEHAILALAKWWTEYPNLDRGPSYMDFPWSSWQDEIRSLVEQHLLRMRSDRVLPNGAPDFEFTPAFWTVAEELRDRIVFDLSTDDDRGVYPVDSRPYGTALTRWLESGYQWGDCGEELYFTASQPAEQYYADRAARRLEEAARSAEWHAKSISNGRELIAKVYESATDLDLDYEVQRAEDGATRIQDAVDTLTAAMVATNSRGGEIAKLVAAAVAHADQARQDLDRIRAAETFVTAQAA